jgi:hypothetical protein
MWIKIVILTSGSPTSLLLNSNAIDSIEQKANVISIKYHDSTIKYVISMGISAATVIKEIWDILNPEDEDEYEDEDEDEEEYEDEDEDEEVEVEQENKDQAIKVIRGLNTYHDYVNNHYND